AYEPEASRPLRARGARADAAAVVLDRQPQRSSAGVQRDGARSSAAVLRDVAERLLRDAIDAELDLGREPRIKSLGQLRANAAAMREVAQVRRQRRRQAEVVQRRRVKQLRHVADAAQRVLADVARLLERAAAARVDVASQRDAD